MQFLMCSPEYYGIYYEINSWMNVQQQAIVKKAHQQWHDLYQTILKVGAKISLVEPIKDLPDMVFTANAGLVYRNQVWISHFSPVERQRESQYFSNWFVEMGYEVVNSDKDFTQPPAFEGAGDALFLDDKLIIGYGIRSQPEAYEQDFFKQFDLVSCQLIDPYFYHLDTCFCPLSPELAMWYPAAFSKQAQAKLRETCELVEVSAEEARYFACNAVVIEKNVILPSRCPKLTEDLEHLGFTVFSCEMTEFIKAGGACKCLTLRL